MIINTGMPRSITGHALSGGIIGFMLGGACAYAKYKNNTISKQEAIIDTAKSTLEGGIVTACGIAAANALGNSAKSPFVNVLEASAYVGVGIASIYAIQNFKSKECALTKKLIKKDI